MPNYAIKRDLRETTGFKLIIGRVGPLFWLLGEMKQTDMTHVEYIQSVHARVTELARGMIAGDIPFLDGSIELASLRSEAEVASDDPDFIVFVAIESEIDHLPVGRVREHWDPIAVKQHEPEIDKAIAWAKEIGLPACSSLIARYGIA